MTNVHRGLEPPAVEFKNPSLVNSSSNKVCSVINERREAVQQELVEPTRKSFKCLTNKEVVLKHLCSFYTREYKKSLSSPYTK